MVVQNPSKMVSKATKITHSKKSSV